MLFNSILGRRQGSNIEEEALLREVSHWRHFRWARWAGTLALAATAFTKMQSDFTRLISERRSSILGIRLSIDDSRVASMEVTVSHILAAGLMGTPPIQIKPDQAALLAPSAAFDKCGDVVKGGAGGVDVLATSRREHRRWRCCTPSRTCCSLSCLSSLSLASSLARALSISQPQRASTTSTPSVTSSGIQDQGRAIGALHMSWFLSGRLRYGCWSW